jgi:hypothetical protein
MDNRVDNRLCEVGFGTAGAVVSFLSVLVLGILASPIYAHPCRSDHSVHSGWYPWVCGRLSFCCGLQPLPCT